MHFIFSFEVMYLNTSGWSVRPKHVAYIELCVLLVYYAASNGNSFPFDAAYYPRRTQI
jgi:hypothetical protein